MKSLEERFWSKVDRRGEDECWEWKASKHKSGHGIFGVGGRKGFMARATRVSMFLAGRLPSIRACNGAKGDDLVLHHCDNAGCVNPAHLYVGTQKNNSDDRIERLDIKYAVGEAVGSSKLTAEQVLEIRQDKSTSGPKLARMYGVSAQTIYDIKRRKFWVHI